MDEERELEVIRNQMEETRASLTDKLEALESEVLGTVAGATNAVADTVETVSDKVHSVTEFFNVRKHVERHPCLMMGGAVAVGFAAGCLIGRRGSEEAPAAAANGEPALDLQPVAGRPPAPTGNGTHRTNGFHEAEPSAEAAREGPLQAGLKKLEALVIGALMGVVRGIVTDVVPDAMADDVVKMVDDFTVGLGGKPLQRDPEQDALKRGASDEGINTPEMGRSVGPAGW